VGVLKAREFPEENRVSWGVVSGTVADYVVSRVEGGHLVIAVAVDLMFLVRYVHSLVVFSCVGVARKDLGESA